MACAQSLGFPQEIGAVTCTPSNSEGLPWEYLTAGITTVATSNEGQNLHLAVRSLSCAGAVHHAKAEVSCDLCSPSKYDVPGLGCP